MQGKLGENSWALILGASSGIGEASARALAKAGLNIFGVHLDRRSTMPHVEEIIGDIRALGRDVEFFNLNAVDAEKRASVIEKMKARLLDQKDGRVRVFLHSLAFGTLKPFIAENERGRLSPAQVAMTLEVMANTLIYWSQALVEAELLERGARIFAMTSAGDFTVIPSYGAVSGAKAALEAYVRQLAVELAPKAITVNAIRAGVTQTPALSKIPGSDRLVEGARQRNPHGRLTQPEDVADAIVALSAAGTHWITGNVIGADGGEDIVG